MKLLNDPLILKFFGYLTPADMAYAILEGMEAPIHKGDRLLLIDNNGNITEGRWGGPESALHGYRTNAIRLPEKFQRPDLEAELEKKVAEIIGRIRQEFLMPHPIIQTFEEFLDLARRAEREKIEREAARAMKEPT